MLKRTIVFLCIVIPTLVFAKPRFHIHAGLTHTTLRQEGGVSQWGKAFGCGLDIPLPSNFILGLNGTVLSKRAYLPQVKLPTSSYYLSDLVIRDLCLDRIYLEFDPKIGYKINLFENFGYFIFSIGYSNELVLDHYSGGEIKYKIIELTESERKDYPFDYSGKDAVVPIITNSLNGGIYYGYSHFGLEIRYKRDQSYSGIDVGYSASDNFDTLLLLLVFQF